MLEEEHPDGFGPAAAELRRAVAGRQGVGEDRFADLEIACPGTAGGDPASGESYADTYMPDDATRDRAKRMHYAAFRAHQANRAHRRISWPDR